MNSKQYGLNGLPIPVSILADSYKISHPFQYPDTIKMVAYGEFRTSFKKDKDDERIVFYGIRYIIENYVSKPWTEVDVEMAETFFKTHNSNFTPFPFPKDLFMKFVKENKGYFPVKIEALPEGTVCYPHVPVYQITAEKEYSRLVTFLETIMTMVWYPSTVATLSRKAKTLIKTAYDKAVDAPSHKLIESSLHDFGFRGCTSIEQSMIGGVSHLLNFRGTDTMSAAFYAQFHLNNGKPVATSIPATEHSVMTSFRTERDAFLHMINSMGEGSYSIVMDSYDFTVALDKVLPSVYDAKLKKGGFMILRPDSGEPAEVVLQALQAAEKVGGATKNSKGYKVLNGFGIIQGDGVDLKKIKEILKKVTKNEYSPQNVSFGMGGGLLQKINRDTMSFATKLNHITYSNGEKRDVMKFPKSDSGKISLPGELEVRLQGNKVPTVYPKNEATDPSENVLKVVYNKGEMPYQWEDFEQIRQRVEEQWNMLPLKHDAISKELRDKIKHVTQKQQEMNQVALSELKMAKSSGQM